jgi:colicin import membrane protein
MPGTDDRLDLAPRAEPGAGRSLALALLVHLLLGAALTWGVRWTSHDPAVSFEAELWSSLPQEAAPAPEATESPVTPSPAPAPPPPVAPAPPPLPAPQPAPPPAPKIDVASDADIALEREKKRKADDKQKALALAEKAAKEKADKEKTEKAEKAEKARQTQEAAAAKAKAAAQAKLDAKKLQAQKEQDAKKQAATEAKLRKENLARLNAQIGATGPADAKGSAPKSSGPSASYGGKVRAKVRPNIVFTEDISGNPVAEVEVRTTLDGTITSQRLVKSSGNKAWDEAVMKAIVRTETMPRDTDGRVPTPMILEFRPRD